LVGAPIICAYCGNQVIVMEDAPLMPPPLPGAAAVPAARVAAAPPARTAVTAASAPPTRQTAALRPPQRTAGAPAAAHGVAPPMSPPTAPPPAMPPAAPPPRRQEPEQVEPFLETYERAVKLQKTSIWPWILAGAMAVAVLIAVVVALLMKQINPNPAPSSIVQQFVANPAAVARLGPRKAGLGYSLQLPADFEETAAPPTEGLPAGTQSIGWAAKEGTEGAGSFCRIWVLPKELNIEQELRGLPGLSGFVEYPANIQNKSSYHRLGNMLAVRGLVDGSQAGSPRKGVIYLLTDGIRTIIVVAMAAGSDMAELQALLDHAVRTIERSEPAKSAT